MVYHPHYLPCRCTDKWRCYANCIYVFLCFALSLITLDVSWQYQSNCEVFSTILNVWRYEIVTWYWSSIAAIKGTLNYILIDILFIHIYKCIRQLSSYCENNSESARTSCSCCTNIYCVVIILFHQNYNKIFQDSWKKGKGIFHSVIFEITPKWFMHTVYRKMPYSERNKPVPLLVI